MGRVTPASNPPTGHNGNFLPPYLGGAEGGPNDPPTSAGVPNYGQRLRRARMAVAIFMVPVLMLFVSFTVVYLIRRGFMSFDVPSATYIRTWLPVRLPWLVLLFNTFVIILSSITIDLARRA